MTDTRHQANRPDVAPSSWSSSADAGAALATSDYHAAATSSDECWQKYAGLGMLGIVEPALEGFARSSEPDAGFYHAATLFIGGEDAAALAILRELRSPEAAALAALVEKSQIQVLAQLPYNRYGPQVLLAGIGADEKFRVANHTVHPEDLPSPPNASVFDWFRGDNVPDFYICNMLEWHAPPADIHEAPFPIFAQTADTDLHIQLLRRWLPSFDTLLVTDRTEHAMLSRLEPGGTVAAAPTPFGWRATEGSSKIRGGERPIDVFMSGIMLRPFFPDKARFLIKLFREKGLNIFVVDGAIDRRQYLELMSLSKTTLCYTRNQTAMVTRGIDALGVGCIPVTARNNVINLSMPDECRFEYSPDFSDVVDAVYAAIATSRESEPELRALAARRIFAPERCASRYMRALTVQTALASLRSKKRHFEPLRDVRRNAQFMMWAIPYEAVARQYFAHNVRTFRQRLKAGWNAEAANNLAREYILQRAEAVRRDEKDGKTARLKCGLRILEIAIAREPRRLVLWLNYIRAAHFLGNDRQRAQAAKKLAELIAADENDWKVSVHDDVLPPDYFENLLDRYTYFDALMRVPLGQDADQAAVEQDLKRYILGSLHWLAGWVFGREDYFGSAYRLHPTYGPIAFDFVISAFRRGKGQLSVEVITATRRLMQEFYLFPHLAAIVVAHAEQLNGRLGEGEMETCRHLLRSFGDRVLPIEAFNYTRGVGPIHCFGPDVPDQASTDPPTGDSRLGLMLCEFFAERPAPGDAIAELERMPWAGLTRAAPFVHPGLPLRDRRWRHVVGNSLKIEYGKLLDRAIRETPGDIVVVVYDAETFVRDFQHRVLSHRDFETPIVLVKTEEVTGRRIVGIVATRRNLASRNVSRQRAGMESLFDEYDIVRQLRQDQGDIEVWFPFEPAAQHLDIPEASQSVPPNRKYFNEIMASSDVDAPIGMLRAGYKVAQDLFHFVWQAPGRIAHRIAGREQGRKH